MRDLQAEVYFTIWWVPCAPLGLLRKDASSNRGCESAQAHVSTLHLYNTPRGVLGLGVTNNTREQPWSVGPLLHAPRVMVPGNHLRTTRIRPSMCSDKRSRDVTRGLVPPHRGEHEGLYSQPPRFGVDFAGRVGKLLVCFGASRKGAGADLGLNSGTFAKRSAAGVRSLYRWPRMVCL